MMLTKENLHDYQKRCVQHILDNSHCGLFLEMGLGKTVTTLTAIHALMYEWLEINRTLVIAPKRVAESVWHIECKKWQHLRGLECSVITGNAKQRRLALNKKADIYLISRDNVAWLCGQYGGSMLPFDMLVIDELSSFKNGKSVRFKALRQVQPCFKRVVGLTGTPAPNGLVDLWAQMYLLDRGERLGKYVTKYRNTYFDKGASNGHIVYRWILKNGGEEAIHRRISDICISMKAEDYLKMPDFVENIIELEMPEDLKKQYKEFEKEKVLELIEDLNDPLGMGEITAVNAAALTNKLLQFANGAVYDEMQVAHQVHDLKIDAMVEIVENSDSPVLVGWTYRSDRDRLLTALKKYKVRELKDNKDIDDWNAGKLDVLMMHPASGGHGLNLQQGGNNIVWFGQTWSLELYQQFNARLFRQGQTKPTFVHKLVVKGTVDKDVVAAQKNKTSKQDALMKAVKARIELYES